MYMYYHCMTITEYPWVLYDNVFIIIFYFFIFKLGIFSSKLGRKKTLFSFGNGADKRHKKTPRKISGSIICYRAILGLLSKWKELNQIKMLSNSIESVRVQTFSCLLIFLLQNGSEFVTKHLLVKREQEHTPFIKYWEMLFFYWGSNTKVLKSGMAS